MAAIVQYYLDPINPDGQFRQASFEGIESHYQSTFGSMDVVANDHIIRIYIVNDYERDDAYIFSFLNATNTHYIEMFGWDEANDKFDNSKVLSTTLYNGTTFRLLPGWRLHDITIMSPNNGFSIDAHNDTTRFKVVYNCIIKGTGAGVGILLYNSNLIHNCLIDGFDVGIKSTANRYNRYITNCTIVNCTTAGFESDSSQTIDLFSNNLLYGNGVNYFGDRFTEDSSHFTLARNNTGVSGDLIPDTVGDTSIVIDQADFKDFAGGDYHITETSKANHSHLFYPLGNNVFLCSFFPPATQQDIDGDDLPQTYNDDNDRWDTGYDYFVIPVTGYKWRIPQSAFVANQVTVSDSTPLEHIDGTEPNTTLGQISSGTNKDTLLIDNGGIVVFENYSNIRGFDIDVTDGEIVFRNTTNQGMQHLGWKKKKLNLQAIGKVTIQGQKIHIETVEDLTESSWTDVWGTTKDDTGNFGEPAVIFVGSTVETALPYFNIGSRTDTISADEIHGRTFKFDQSTGLITFPHNQPSSSDNVYCYNIMIHSKDGLSPAPTDCYGFRTVFNGQVDGECFYNTGYSNFSDSTGVTLIDYGCIQPLEIENCSSASLKVYRANSAVAPVDTESVLSKLKDLSLGEFHSLAPTGLILRGMRGCTLDRLWIETLSDNPSVILGGVAAGNDDINLTEVTSIGGGVKLAYALSILINIENLNHSNDITSSNSRDSQPVVMTDSYGFRNLNVSLINSINNGFTTSQNLLQFYNSGNFTISDVQYQGAVNALLYASSCFNGFITKATVNKFDSQCLILNNSSNGIKAQSVKCTQSPTPVEFDEYNSCSDILLKNVAIEDVDRFLDQQAFIPDMNFMELNKYNGTGYDGYLVVNFSRSSKNVFIFTNSARSNQTDGVMLRNAGDSVEIEFAYPIKVGSSTSYFADIEPIITATNPENMTFEYAIRQDGPYSDYKVLNASNLSSEVFAEDSEFRVKFRVASVVTDSSNLIKQIALQTTPDVDVVYPVDEYILTVDSQNGDDLIGAQVSIYNADGIIPGDLGTELAEDNNNPTPEFQYIHYGETNPIYIQVIKRGYVEQLISFTLEAQNQTVYIDLEEDEHE